MKIRLKIKQEHLTELLQRGTVAIAVDDHAAIKGAEFILRPVVQLVRGEDVRRADIIDALEGIDG